MCNNAENGFLNAREEHYQRFFGPMNQQVMHSTDFKTLHVDIYQDEFPNLVLDGERVDFLWMVPITEAEREYAVKNGSEALLKKFEKQRIPQVIDESRKSLV